MRSCDQETLAVSGGTYRPRLYDHTSSAIPAMIIGSDSHWPIDKFIASKPR